MKKDDRSLICRFFKLPREPFTAGMPAKYLFESENAKDIAAKLLMTAERNAFAVLTGPVGTGKSTQLRRFAASLNKDDYAVFYVSSSSMTPRTLYTLPLQSMGITPKYYVSDLKFQLQHEFQRLREIENKKVVYLVDEAQLIDHFRRSAGSPTLQELRFLLNANYDSGNPISIVLAGQDELWNNRGLGNPENIGIVQRIDYLCQTAPLHEDEVEPYIKSHLTYAGATAEIFESGAVREIINSTHGVPRTINKLCIHAMYYAAFHETAKVTAEIVKEVIASNEMPASILKYAGA